MSSEFSGQAAATTSGRFRWSWRLPFFLLASMFVLPAANASAAGSDWRSCSRQLAEESEAALAGEARRACIIAVARTYLHWAAGDLAAEELPLSDDFLRRRLGTSREDASTDRQAFLNDPRPELIASVTEREWFVEGDVVWAIFTVVLKAQPESVHWVAERFTVKAGKIRDILAVPTVVKP